MPYWKETQTVEHDGIPVYVNNRMTEYEANRWRARADKLLSELRDQLADYEIESLAAYGSARRIGVRLARQHDPLGNGIMVGNVDGFDVEAVSPIDHETAYIRFQEQSDD